MSTKNLFFRMTCIVNSNNYDHKLYAEYFIRLYKVDSWQLESTPPKIYMGDCFATLKFSSNELSPDNTEEKPSAYQPKNFVDSTYPIYADFSNRQKFRPFTWYDTELRQCNSFERVADCSKALNSTLAKVQKAIDSYNLHYKHGNCEFGKIAEALLKCGIQQITSDKGYDLMPTGDNRNLILHD